MQVIELQPIPKQSLSVTLGGLAYEIDMLSTNGVMSANITRGGVVVVRGQRCVAGQLVIPFRGMEGDQGNFMFLTQNDELPDYVSFGTTQFFLYASNAELAAVRATPQTILATLTAAATIQGAATVHAVGHV